MINFIFDKETHKYFLDNQEIPSVTQILNQEIPFNKNNTIPLEILERSTQWGKAVHKLTELYDKKILSTEFDVNLLDDYNNWKRFIDDYKVNILEIEKPIYSLKWQFAGTPDRIITSNEGNLDKLFTIKNDKRFILLDIKTSAILSPIVRLQTALYKIAYEEMNQYRIKERWCIRLLGKNGYKIIPYRNKLDELAALSFLNCYYWKKENL